LSSEQRAAADGKQAGRIYNGRWSRNIVAQKRRELCCTARGRDVQAKFELRTLRTMVLSCWPTLNAVLVRWAKPDGAMPQGPQLADLRAELKLLRSTFQRGTLQP